MAAPVLRGFRLGFGHHSCITSSDGAAASIFNSYRDIPRVCKIKQLWCLPKETSQEDRAKVTVIGPTSNRAFDRSRVRKPVETFGASCAWQPHAVISIN
jgi:hypothetical protein